MTEALALTFLLGLAVARATRLWRDDEVTAPVRDPLLRWLEGDRRGRVAEWFATLLDCPWCISGWFAAGAVLIVDSATSRSVPLPVGVWLACWSVACIVYWLTESLYDGDQVLWHVNESKGG